MLAQIRLYNSSAAYLWVVNNVRSRSGCSADLLGPLREAGQYKSIQSSSERSPIFLWCSSLGRLPHSGLRSWWHTPEIFSSRSFGLWRWRQYKKSEIRNNASFVVSQLGQVYAGPILLGLDTGPFVLRSLYSRWWCNALVWWNFVIGSVVS